VTLAAAPKRPSDRRGLFIVAAIGILVVACLFLYFGRAPTRTDCHLVIGMPMAEREIIEASYGCEAILERKQTKSAEMAEHRYYFGPVESVVFRGPTHAKDLRLGPSIISLSTEKRRVTRVTIGIGREGEAPVGVEEYLPLLQNTGFQGSLGLLPNANLAEYVTDNTSQRLDAIATNPQFADVAGRVFDILLDRGETHLSIGVSVNDIKNKQEYELDTLRLLYLSFACCDRYEAERLEWKNSHKGTETPAPSSPALDADGVSVD